MGERAFAPRIGFRNVRFVSDAVAKTGERLLQVRRRFEVGDEKLAKGATLPLCTPRADKQTGQIVAAVDTMNPTLELHKKPRLVIDRAPDRLADAIESIAQFGANGDNIAKGERRRHERNELFIAFPLRRVNETDRVAFAARGDIAARSHSV